jgi:hypothetical protein
MKTKLFQSPSIEIRKSPIHGYGIFASDDLPANTIIEEVPFMEVTLGVLYQFSYLYPKFDTPEFDKYCVRPRIAIPHGFACLYNHSDNCNVTWATDTKNELFIFSTIRDIVKDEELFIYYGNESYWQEHKNVTKV